MIHLQGRIRDYDSLTDTASVEFDGQGWIENWVDKLKIDASLNRSYLVHGSPVTVQAPDAHRLICDGLVVGVGDSPTSPVSYSGASLQLTQTGRAFIGTDGTGSGSVAVRFTQPFSSAPQLSLTVDEHVPPVVSGISTTGFTATISHSGSLNGYVYLSWHASGNR
ncbi:MAG: hypothetical protein ACRDFX_03440 [Chloroflexota bacterium]